MSEQDIEKIVKKAVEEYGHKEKEKKNGKWTLVTIIGGFLLTALASGFGGYVGAEKNIAVLKERTKNYSIELKSVRDDVSALQTGQLEQWRDIYKYHPGEIRGEDYDVSKEFENEK